MKDDPYLRADRDDAVQALQDVLVCLDTGSKPEAIRERVQGFFGRIAMRRMGVAPDDLAEKKADMASIRLAPKTGLKTWIKRVYAVDEDERGGYAFLGPFVSPSTTVRLPNLTILLRYDQGSESPNSVVTELSLVLKGDANTNDGMQHVFGCTGAHWAKAMKPECVALLNLVAEQKHRDRAESAAKPPSRQKGNPANGK